MKPLHVTGEVLASKKVGAYRHLTLVAPGIPERFRPGTFVALSVGGEAARSRLARRAFWIHRVKPVGGYGATLEIVVEPVGVGTGWLAALAPGARLEVTGPLGRAFALPQEKVGCLLVGEGYAAAPLFPLAERLRERDCPVTLVVAGDDEAHLLSALEARRSARSVTVVTRDGSVGQRGEVADVIDEVLTRSGAEVVYAAGPSRTLHAVAAAAERHGAWSQTAVERPLTCATGLCQGCPVPVVGEDGVARLVRGCVDGPVFRGDRVRWDDLEAQ
ncbi:dihydroorotate dehydrogenase electron transfer subunit [Nocardioides sp. KIGAM211]|uniref:Dihydroorotate dehydrogenase electron transfer subunit n=1 Tax=Nocardioides luti TaxID=2761101 RepID=A0A7X0VC65_9ACTN|nr:dihydroorotate dehydrogenase electron transfer subunit [Nocardioides luti]MBB6629474.1 dihydroorotate dehydrogenase electron transfer subunit [Nocardioides luti]